MKYAPLASERFNSQFGKALDRLARDTRLALGDNLAALVLGGGYGRGEGGVVRRAGQESPYNDIDLFVVVHDKRALAGGKLGEIRRRYEHELGIEVDIGRPLTLPEIRTWPIRLMWKDLLEGHLVLDGPQDVLDAHAPERLRGQLPAVEAAKLLLNRGAGLLWAVGVARGAADAPDPDFVRRNAQKCILAMGDALLILRGEYTASCEKRLQSLRRATACPGVACSRDMASLYEEAVAFKLSPDSVPDAQPDETRLASMAKRWGRVFLAVESSRLKRGWANLDDYVGWKGVREPEEHAMKNLVRNAGQNLRMGRLSLRYPRERLYRRLPRLLGLARERAEDFADETERFFQVWRRFN